MKRCKTCEHGTATVNMFENECLDCMVECAIDGVEKIERFLNLETKEVLIFGLDENNHEVSEIVVVPK